MAWAISLEVHRKEGKTKFTDKPRTYNYVMECLLRKTAFNFRFNSDNPTVDTRKELYAAATELTNKTKAVKVICGVCNGTGEKIRYNPDIKAHMPLMTCPKCNGHGFLIEKQVYRVGTTFNHFLVIDIDNHDMNNLKDVVYFYQDVLKLKFRIFKTNKGFWLIGGRRYNDVKSFVNAHLLVLCPDLDLTQAEAYRKALMDLDKDNGKEFIPATAEIIKNSGLYHGHGKFDVAFTFLSIKRERSTLRESAKGKDDKVEEVFI